MSEKAGEIARESGEFRYCKCSEPLSVRVGFRISDCAEYGGARLQTGSQTLQNRIAYGYAAPAL